jgi:peptidoglycan/LPS O-acetylase OafA/YrhL
LLLQQINTQGRVNLAGFYRRRIARLFPALILVMLFSLCLGHVVLIDYEYRSLGLHLISGAAFLSNYVLATEGSYFDLPAHSKPLLHLWSLAVEEQYYPVFPVFALFARHSRQASSTVVVWNSFHFVFAMDSVVVLVTVRNVLQSIDSRLGNTQRRVAQLAAVRKEQSRKQRAGQRRRFRRPLRMAIRDRRSAYRGRIFGN